MTAPHRTGSQTDAVSQTPTGNHFLAGPPGVRGNASRAYIAAGYAPKAAYSGASELLRKPRIQDAIAAYLRKADLTVDRVLEELRRVAFSDMGDVATWGPEGVVLKASAELPDDVTPAVADVIEDRMTRTTTRVTPAVGRPGEPSYQPPGEVTTVTEERHLRVKLHDKIAALGHLSKYLGLLKDRNDEPERPLFPKGFFAAIVTGDVSKIQGFLPGVALDEDAPPPPVIEATPDA